MKRVALCLFLTAIVLGGLLWWLETVPGPRQPDVPIIDTPRKGGTDVTFFVAADTRVGYRYMEQASAAQIREMNALPGLAYPEDLGSKVARPRGVLIAGDLTENGREDEWRAFERLYGRDGTDALLKYPVFLGSGNHDRRTHPDAGVVIREIRRRHGSEFYSWDWDDLHLICLDEAPTDRGLRWLGKDLARTGRKRPIVLFLHFPLAGAFSESNWFGKGPQKQQLAEMLAGFQIVGIFHGHYHKSTRTSWEGYDVYNVGSPKHLWRSFAVVRVTDTTMTVVSRDWVQHLWRWSHRKRINPGR